MIVAGQNWSLSPNIYAGIYKITKQLMHWLPDWQCCLTLHPGQCLLRDKSPHCTAVKFHYYFSLFQTLFASSTLNLCELVGLRPDLGKLRKILYFHENQLVYPVRKHKDRDFQYGYNQILSWWVKGNSGQQFTVHAVLLSFSANREISVELCTYYLCDLTRSGDCVACWCTVFIKVIVLHLQ